jgi:hypothetical protein
MNDTDLVITVVLIVLGAVMLAAGWGIHSSNSGGSYDRTEPHIAYQRWASVMAVTGAALMALPVLKMIKLYVLG